ncbi:MAG: ABC transporter ATP-binding protein [Syntrophotaleaceae bacterium]
MDVLLKLRNFSFSYPETDKAVFRGVNLQIEAGRCYCLTGPTGSGKTTLAMAIKGLLGAGTVEGTLEFSALSSGEEPRVGIVLQDPEVQLLTTSVGAEVAFGLENLCVEPDEMAGSVMAALEAVGLDKPLHFPVSTLSMGQKYRLLIASLLVMEPHILILDEPGAQLDPEGLELLSKILLHLKEKGVALVLCEHRPDYLLPIVDHFWQLDGCGDFACGRWAGTEDNGSVSPPPSPSVPQKQELVRVENLHFRGVDGQPVWAGVSFSISRGERVAITGFNGTGKTTLLRCLAGFLEPEDGTIRILDGAPNPYRLRGRLGCLFQNPQKQIFENTVREEVAFPLKRFGLSSTATAERVAEALDACGISHLAELSPHKLSYGQKHLVALASVLAPRPELLLLDDPLAGVDGFYSRRVMELLVGWGRENNATLIWTSHEPKAWPGWTDKVLHLEGGHLAAA